MHVFKGTGSLKALEHNTDDAPQFAMPVNKDAQPRKRHDHRPSPGRKPRSKVALAAAASGGLQRWAEASPGEHYLGQGDPKKPLTDAHYSVRVSDTLWANVDDIERGPGTVQISEHEYSGNMRQRRTGGTTVKLSYASFLRQLRKTEELGKKLEEAGKRITSHRRYAPPAHRTPPTTPSRSESGMLTHALVLHTGPTSESTLSSFARSERWSGSSLTKCWLYLVARKKHTQYI